MIHIMNGPWKFTDSNLDLFINCKEIYSFIKIKKYTPINIPIDRIAYKSVDDICIHAPRYMNANPELPGILIQGMENPFMKEYRMVDGRHRLLKTLNAGCDYFNSYVLQRDEILRFIKIL